MTPSPIPIHSYDTASASLWLQCATKLHLLLTHFGSGITFPNKLSEGNLDSSGPNGSLPSLGWKLPNIHEILHIAYQITMFGSLDNCNSGPDESVFKKLAKNPPLS
jgi:hypothetical protein